MTWYDDLDQVIIIYVNWMTSRNNDSPNAYFGDIEECTLYCAKIMFVNGWINNIDPFTGKFLIDLECFKKFKI